MVRRYSNYCQGLYNISAFILDIASNFEFINILKWRCKHTGLYVTQSKKSIAVISGNRGDHCFGPPFHCICQEVCRPGTHEVQVPVSLFVLLTSLLEDFVHNCIENDFHSNGRFEFI